MGYQLIPESVHEGNTVLFIRVHNGKFLKSKVLDRVGHYGLDLHGESQKVSEMTHCVWSSDDGDGIPESSEITWPAFININSDLDDDYPSIVTAVSCYVGCPEIKGNSNLGIDLLKNPNLKKNRTFLEELSYFLYPMPNLI